MPGYKLIDHTGDIGIAIAASDLESLFATAAWSLFDLICDLDSVQECSEIAIRLEETDLEALLVAWLNELLFHQECSHMLFKAFELSISDRFILSASLRGEVFDAKRHEIHRDFKAATYHQLEVKQNGGMWTAQIIFDV